MNAVFADTFYWIAFTDVRDLAHESVNTFTRVMRQLDRPSQFPGGARLVRKADRSSLLIVGIRCAV